MLVSARNGLQCTGDCWQLFAFCRCRCGAGGEEKLSLYFQLHLGNNCGTTLLVSQIRNRLLTHGLLGGGGVFRKPSRAGILSKIAEKNGVAQSAIFGTTYQLPLLPSLPSSAKA